MPLARDLAFALRRLRRTPLFAGVVIATLALGIGASTAVFSLVNAILIEPLPYPEPNRLVRLTNSVSSGAAATVDESDALVLLYQRQARSFSAVGAWRFDDGDLGATEPGQNTIRVRGARVTANFFDVLGARPALGRAFSSGEDRPGRNGVVVLSHRVWETRFHADPRAIGRQIVVNDVSRTIVGIMPPTFAYPARDVELWLPLSLDPAHTHAETFNLVGIARLERGSSIAAARADLARALTHASDDFATDASAASWQQAHVTPHVELLRDTIVGPIARLLWLVFGSVLLVLFAACTNVAALFLVRAERAQTELAVRRALGAGLGGVLATALAESVLLSVAGGILGLLLASASTQAAVSAGSVLSLPRLQDVRIGVPVLLFAIGTTFLCALAVSVLPLLRARRVSVAQVLRGAGVAGPTGRAQQRARNTLVAAQIALAFVLVASSGLLARSFLHTSSVRPGFDANHTVTARVLLPYARYGTTAPRLAFFQALASQAQTIPGARDVALTDWVPLSGDHRDMALDVEDSQSPASGSGSSHTVASVDDRYFAALRIPVLRGRGFTAPDVTRPSDDVVVSRGFAERYWPGVSPLGKRVRPVGGQWYTVVGEVGDVHYDALDQPANDLVYFPIVTPGTGGIGATMPGALSVVVRTDGRASDALSDVRRIVAALDPAVPTYDENNLQQLVTDASARSRALMLLLAIASLVTSLLGAIGLYGVVAYIVSTRRREFGIRIALGAQPTDVSRAISLDGVRIAAIGIAIGMACTLATSHFLRGLLYDVSPTDLLTLSVTPAALLVIALAASWIPARRAAAIDPAEALRAQ
ncbi:MAG TPA: ABC transporter permease [Gemmatimonadaceae bacterium]|jgi:predicted permease